MPGIGSGYTITGHSLWCVHRVIHAHRVYTPFRTTSVTVRTHSAAVGNFRVTRTRTNITGPRGKTTTVKKTTVTGPRGWKKLQGQSEETQN
jgi:hypothetical protein